MEHIVFKYGNQEPIKAPTWKDWDEIVYYDKKPDVLRQVMQIGNQYYLFECITHRNSRPDLWEHILKDFVRKELHIGMVGYKRTYIDDLTRKELFDYLIDNPLVKCHHYIYNSGRCSMSSYVPHLDVALYLDEMRENYNASKDYLKRIGHNYLYEQLDQLWRYNSDGFFDYNRKVIWIYEDVVKYINKQVSLINS